jgi:tRNA 2-selenouridine synthase SelU
MIKTSTITEAEFLKSHLPVLFHQEKYSKNYYQILEDDVGLFIFSAQSDISPELVEGYSIAGVGCDQNVVIFDFKSKKIINKIVLPCFFYEFKKNRMHLLIISEVNLKVIRLNNYCEMLDLDFIDNIDHVDVFDGYFTVYLVGGDKNKFELSFDG